MKYNLQNFKIIILLQNILINIYIHITLHMYVYI